MPPELIVTEGVLVVFAAPHVSVPAMAKVPPLFTTMLLPALLPEVLNVPPFTVTPPVKLLAVLAKTKVPEERETPPPPLNLRVKFPP